MAEWISVTEAAKMSGYHRIYLLELLRNGKIGAKKIVTVWQIDRVSLLAYMKAANNSDDKRRGAKSKKPV